MTTLKIPYGKRSLKFSLSADRLSGVLENKRARNEYKDVGKLLSESLDNPSSKDSLEALAFRAKKILVVVPDATRSSHLKKILPLLFRRIAIAKRGVIDIIVATGLHKEHNSRQLKGLLGEAVLRNHGIISHEQTKSSLTNFGLTETGIPAILNTNLTKYDLIISVGVIEPHLYAGYSGGAKTIAIGLAGEETINATHSIAFLDNSFTRIGAVKDNPFQNALWNIVDNISIGFAINVVNDSDGAALKIFSGDIKRVFKDGVKFAKDVFEVEVERPSDIVICGIGYPKDINLYQASRAINYLVNVDRPIIKKGGVLIVAAELSEGVGGGLSEKRFYNELKGLGSPEEFVKRVKRMGCVAGEHRAYMVAKALMDYDIVFVTRSARQFMKGLPFPFFKNIEPALRYADRLVSEAPRGGTPHRPAKRDWCVGKKDKLYVVPRALSTIARLK